MSGTSGELAGHTFLITGGNAGIGRATAADLARQGGRVYVACRSPEKGRGAVADIVAATGNDAVAFLPLDLADLASVRRCAEEFLALGEPLHVLINNGGEEGAMTSLYCATSDSVAAASGRFYDNSREREASSVATPDLARAWWEHSQAWITV